MRRKPNTEADWKREHRGRTDTIGPVFCSTCLRRYSYTMGRRIDRCELCGEPTKFVWEDELTRNQQTRVFEIYLRERRKNL